MKLTKRILLILLILLPGLIHVFQLNSTLINFPHFGDDFLFLEFLTFTKSHPWEASFLKLFDAHNDIHRIAFARFSSWVYLIFFHSFNFKYFTILGNLFLFGIGYIIFKYLKNDPDRFTHLICISLLLFSGYPNLDNYSSIGVYQHTAFLYFFIAFAYLITRYTIPIWAFFMPFFAPFISTEGWLMIPIFIAYLFSKNNPHAIRFTWISLSASVLFFIFTRHPTEIKIIEWTHYIDSPKAFFILIGNIFWPISDSHRPVINTLVGIILFLLTIIFSIKKMKRTHRFQISFPQLILLQIYGTNLMICLGRAGSENIATVVLSERFFTYATIHLVALYLLIKNEYPLNTFQKFSLITIFLLFYVGSFIANINPLTLLHKRLVLESTHLFYSKTPHPFSSNRISIMAIDPFSLFQPEVKNILPIPTEKELILANSSPVRDTIILESNPSNSPFISLRCKKNNLTSGDHYLFLKSPNGQFVYGNWIRRKNTSLFFCKINWEEKFDFSTIACFFVTIQNGQITYLSRLVH